MTRTKSKTPRRYATHLTTPTGERVYIAAKSKEELEEKILEKKLELRAGVNITVDMSFKDYAELWLHTYKEGRIKASSLALIRANLKNHVIPFFGEMMLKDIKPMHVQLFLKKIANYSPSLQAKCLQIVKGVLQTAVDNGMIVRTPVRKEDRITRDTGVVADSDDDDDDFDDVLTDDQARALLAAVAGTRAYTFCLLALSTGMRRGEILGLMWTDVDFETSQIHVRHNKAFPCDKEDAEVTTPKTRAGRRDLPMSPALAAHLQSIRAESSSPFVLSMANGKSLTKSSFRSLWQIVESRTAGEGEVPRKLGDHYGGVQVTLDFHSHPHQLRHTYITQLFEAGLDLKQIQYLAGHAKPEMTMRIYTHYRKKQRAGETHSAVCTALNYLAAPEKS